MLIIPKDQELGELFAEATLVLLAALLVSHWMFMRQRSRPARADL